MYSLYIIIEIGCYLFFLLNVQDGVIVRNKCTDFDKTRNSKNFAYREQKRTHALSTVGVRVRELILLSSWNMNFLIGRFETFSIFKFIRMSCGYPGNVIDIANVELLSIQFSSLFFFSIEENHSS